MELLIALFLIIAGVFIILTVGRMLACWYFKINERIDIENKILAELRKLNNKE